MPTNNKKTFSAEELAAMRERAKELRENKLDGESAVLAKINEMPEEDRIMALKIHEIVKTSAPTLKPKTWYGMPAYANKDGKVVCFFQSAHKFNYRYTTLGFSDVGNLDDGNMWPNSYALKKLTDKEEGTIAALVKKAVS